MARNTPQKPKTSKRYLDKIVLAIIASELIEAEKGWVTQIAEADTPYVKRQ